MHFLPIFTIFSHFFAVFGRLVFNRVINRVLIRVNLLKINVLVINNKKNDMRVFDYWLKLFTFVGYFDV